MVPGGGLARVGVEIEENGAKDREKDAPRMLRVARRGDDFFDGHVVFAIAIVVNNIVNVAVVVGNIVVDRAYFRCRCFLGCCNPSRIFLGKLVCRNLK